MFSSAYGTGKERKAGGHCEGAGGRHRQRLQCIEGEKGVSENLRLRVRKKAEEMGYHPGTEPSASQGGAVSIGVVIAERYVKIYPSF